MSAIGVLLAKVVGSVGGPVATGAVVAGGIAVGAIGGGLFASGGGQQASAGGELAVYPCPNQGPAVATIHAGQQVLATGRTADSTWLRIHFPDPSRAEAWVQAGPLTVAGAVASLPVAECQPELAIVAPSVEPAESMTAVQDNPPSAAPATPTPTPTAAVTATPNSRPVLASLTASTGQISFDPGTYCPTAVKQVTFKVKATDTGGVSGVSLFWRKPGVASFTETPMSRVAGSPTNGTWQVTLNTTANGITGAGNLAYYAQARDAANATRRVPVSTASTIKVKVCQNTGPTITSASSNQGNTLYWNPLGAPGNCQTASNITAVIKDTDGVASATLFYRRPGDGSFQSKPMDNTTIKGKWFANLDTLGDKITIPNPPTGTLRWYIKSADTKGASSQSPTRSITIRRCDSEATFFVNSLSTTQFSNCNASFQLRWSFSITDPDEAQSAPMTATLRYTIRNTYTGPGGGKTLTQTVSAAIVNSRFSIDSKTLSSNTFYGNNEVTWQITTKDKYGGTSSSSSKSSFSVLACIG
jgi:hypothetical protein